MVEQASAASIYEKLESDRGNFLRRARAASKLTVPTILPDSDLKGADLLDPYQSLGARGVNNLASKLLLTLLPPHSPFFKYGLAPDIEAELRETEALTEIQSALSIREQTMMSTLEGMGARPQLFEVLKHLLVAGNVVLKVSKDKKKPKARVFHLSQYVVERDGEGTINVLCIKEKISPHKLPEEVRRQIQQSTEDAEVGAEKNLDLYTLIQRQTDGQLSVRQEVGNVLIPDSEGTFTDDSMPYLVLRWESISDESYGRSFVEQYMGDLKSLEGLSMAIVQGSAISAQVKFMVEPNSNIDVKRLTLSPNGSFHDGKIDDIGALQVAKHADLSVAAGSTRDLEVRLSQAFLLNSSVTRDAERVTAEEVRFIAQELEDALGGAYSNLTQELQYPLIKRIEAILSTGDAWTKLPADVAEIVIVTGLEALGRGHEVNKIQAFLGVAQQNLGPQMLEYIDVGALLTRLATGLGVDISDIIRPEEEVMQNRAQAQQAAMQQATAPEVVRQVGAAAQAGETAQ